MPVLFVDAVNIYLESEIADLHRKNNSRFFSLNQKECMILLSLCISVFFSGVSLRSSVMQSNSSVTIRGIEQGRAEPEIIDPG